MIRAVHAGSFPRVGDRPEQQALRRAYDAHQRGELDDAGLARAADEAVRLVTGEQSRAGMEMVSDGQVRWADPVSHLMGRLTGVRLGGLVRWFDTATFYRQPQATGPISASGPLVADDFKFARAIAPRPVVPTITGPFTLSRLTLPGGPYPGADALLGALTPVMAEEVALLANAGATDIVVEEHWILKEPEGLDALSGALEALAGRRGPARLWLRVSFGDATALYPLLQKLPVDGLILDFTRAPALAELVRRTGSDLPLGLGMVDARNTRIEDSRVIARVVRKLLKRIPGTAWLTTSCGLEYLPLDRAREKLGLVARVSALVAGRKAPKAAGRSARRSAKRRRSPGAPCRGKGSRNSGWTSPSCPRRRWEAFPSPRSWGRPARRSGWAGPRLGRRKSRPGRRPRSG